MHNFMFSRLRVHGFYRDGPIAAATEVNLLVSDTLNNRILNVYIIITIIVIITVHTNNTNAANSDGRLFNSTDNSV